MIKIVNKMKKLLTIISLITIALCSFSQTYIRYEYDDAGNRIVRKVVSIRSSGSSTDIAEEVEQDKIDEFNISIFPNPTQGNLNVNIDGLNEEKSSILVYDLNGREIFSVNELKSENLIDITRQPSGTYIMIINIDDKRSQWKIMKE